MPIELLGWLGGGDLRSDGLATEVAAIVLQNSGLIPDLLEGLAHREDVVRGRAADALEKITRVRPDYLIEHLAIILEVAGNDPVPMVRWHLAMVLGHLAMYSESHALMVRVLFEMLGDESVFVRSWAISGLCVVGRKYPDYKAPILEQIERQRKDKSIAIRTRVETAIRLLMDDTAPFPKGWLKSAELLKELG